MLSLVWEVVQEFDSWCEVGDNLIQFQESQNDDGDDVSLDDGEKDAAGEDDEADRNKDLRSETIQLRKKMDQED